MKTNRHDGQRALIVGLSVVLLAAVTVWAGWAPQAIAQITQPGWIGYYRPGSLFVPHPQGWQVQEHGEGSFLVLLPGADGFATAMVYAKPQRFDARRNAADALGLLPREEAALFPDARILRASVEGQSITGELAFAVKGQAYKGAVLVLAGTRGSGALYVISAAERMWPSQKEVMAKILQGFAYMPAGSSAGAVQARIALPAMQTWRDPLESAFTVPVPQGWDVQGGLKRSGLKSGPEVLVASPDNAIQIRLGDPAVPMFSVPYSIPMTGTVAEGTVSTGGLVVWRYLPGLHFLTSYYLPRKFNAMSGMQTQDLPELAAQSFRTSPPAPPAQGRADAGMVTFNAQLPIGPRRLSYTAITHYQEVPGLNASGTWRVETLVGYLFTPEREPLAQAVLAEMYRGFAWDLRWLESELRFQGQIAQKVIDHTRQMNEIHARTLEIKAQGGERAAAARAGAARGEIKVQDSTGRTIVVPQTGSQDYYRVNPTGDIIATDRTDLPPFDYERLWRVPW